MKEIVMAALLLGAAAFVIGFAFDTIGRASRRDAKRRNQTPPTVTSVHEAMREARPEVFMVATDEPRPIHQPRGRVNRDRLN